MISQKSIVIFSITLIVITIVAIVLNIPSEKQKSYLKKFSTDSGVSSIPPTISKLDDSNLDNFLKLIPKCLHINTLSIDTKILLDFLPKYEEYKNKQKLYIDTNVLNSPVINSNNLLFTTKETNNIEITKDNLNNNVLKDKIKNKLSAVTEIFATKYNIYKQIQNIKLQYFSLFEQSNTIKYNIYKNLLENYINNLHYCSIVFYIDYLQFDYIINKDPLNNITGVIPLLNNIISDINKDVNKDVQHTFICELPRSLSVEDMKNKIIKIKEYNDLLTANKINGILITPSSISEVNNDISFYSELWSNSEIFENSDLKLYLNAENYNDKNIENSNVVQAIPLKPSIILNNQNIISYPYIIKIIQNNIIDPIQNIDDNEDEVESITWLKNSYKDIKLNICPLLDILTNYYANDNMDRYYGKLLINVIPNNVTIISPLFTYFNNNNTSYSLIDEYKKCYDIGIPLENIIYIIVNTHQSVFTEDTKFSESINTFLGNFPR